MFISSHSIIALFIVFQEVREREFKHSFTNHLSSKRQVSFKFLWRDISYDGREIR